MHSKRKIFSNFSRAMFSESSALRPDNESQLADYLTHHNQSILTRGAGLSYNDSCFNSDGFIIESERFNHLISFDPLTGIAVCQGGVPLKDLFLLHKDFIPAVIPGTVHATVAGSIAHDVHGKNNHLEGCFGHHVIWIELLIGSQKIRCSREDHPELFHATTAGLGLTGIITRVALRLKKAPRGILVQHQQFTSLEALTTAMSTSGLNYDYQVAWIDLLHQEPRSILSFAQRTDSLSDSEHQPFSVPKVPFSMIRSWNMKLFNTFFFNSKKNEEQLSLQEFNNPLDKLKHWNRLYGPRGLMQFQAVFESAQANTILERLLQLIRSHKATPTLAVLKLLTQQGEGLLSFCKPGFTLAIDFIHNEHAKQAINAMNQLVTEMNGRIYLAKDWMLNAEQFVKMYDKHQQFSQVLKQYHCNMHSDLSKRLGILK